jgi:hypothetical protein
MTNPVEFVDVVHPYVIYIPGKYNMYVGVINRVLITWKIVMEYLPYIRH